jgi:hypothetical protein
MNFNYIGSVKGRSGACDFNCASLPRNCMSHKYDGTIVAGDEMSPMRHFFNSDLDEISSF